MPLAVTRKGTKEEYESKVGRQLGKTDERLKELESQSEQAIGDTKRKVEEESAGLKDERAVVEGKTARLALFKWR